VNQKSNQEELGSGARVQLLAMRHGTAGWATADPERALTERGRASVKQVAERLLSELPAPPQRLFTSPYPRARETASIAGKILGVAVEQLSELAAAEASPAALLAALRALAPPATRLMIVGHAPDLTDLVSELTGNPPAPLGTAEVAQLEGDQIERTSMKLVRIWSAEPGSAH
jgi:phosphohistidine phosphatase SixA